MKIIEDIKTLMVSGAARNKKQRKTQAAQGVAEFKKTLLTALKEVSINGSAELIVTMEQAIVQHDLEYYTNSVTMKGSLKIPQNALHGAEFCLILPQTSLHDATKPEPPNIPPNMRHKRRVDCP